MSVSTTRSAPANAEPYSCHISWMRWYRFGWNTATTRSPRVAAVAGGTDHGVDLGREVGVVVDEGRPTVDTAHVEATGDAPEAGERGGDVVERTPRR